jgi:hypothetical protein
MNNLNDKCNNVVNITYIMQKLKLDDDIDDVEIEMKGVLVNFNSKTFIISVHNGYPIDKVIIDGKTFDDFIICAWCDLILIPYQNQNNNKFVFKQFVKKQMEPEDKYFSNNNSINNIKLKYINNSLIQIGHITKNPIIMYNCLKISSLNENHYIEAGSPIYNENNKLAGIVSKTINNDSHSEIYSVPVNYILKAMTKTDNTKLYTLVEDIDNIDKINNYKIICKKIYCNLHKIYIPVDTYIAIHGDISIFLSIIFHNGRYKKVSLYEMNNNMSNNNLLVDKNTIKLSYGLITYLNALEEYKLIEKIGNIGINGINVINNNITWNNYNIIY